MKVNDRLPRTGVKNACASGESTVWETRLGEHNVALHFTTSRVTGQPSKVSLRRSGRAGGKWAGRALVELHAHWSLATAAARAGNGRQRWKLIGLCGKGGKGSENYGFVSDPLSQSTDYDLLQAEVTTGWYREYHPRSIVILQASPALPPALGPDPFFSLPPQRGTPRGERGYAADIPLCPSALLSGTPVGGSLGQGSCPCI